MTETRHSRPIFPPAGVARYNIFASPIGPRIHLETPGDGGATPPATPPAGDPPATTPPATTPDPAKPTVTDAEAKLLRDVMKHKKAAEEAQSQLAAFQGLGLDAEGIKKLVEDKRVADEAAAEAERKELEKKGEYDRLIKMAGDENARLVKAEKDRADGIQAQLTKALGTIDELTIGQGFAGSSFIAKELVLTPAKARTIYGSHYEVEDGVAVAYDKPKGAAERTKLVGADGKPLAFDEAIKRIVELDPDKDTVMRSTRVEGAGSSTTDQRPSDKPKGLSGLSRIEAALAKAKPQV